MILRITSTTFLICFLALTSGFSKVAMPEGDVVKATREWLTNCTNGNRAALNATMEEGFIATTPAGEVLPKARLVPDDPSQAIQRLPAMELESPLVRLYGTTAVLMGRLQSTSDSKQALNGTFVYIKQGNGWRLVSMHLSPQR